MKLIPAVLFISALTAVSAFAGDWTGYISDTKCAAANAKAGAASEWVKPAAFEECAKKCVQEGSAPVFVTADNKILKIGDSAKARVLPLLGHKVAISGKVEGDTLVRVDSISPQKM